MTHICQRRDTLANWELYDPVLMEGEVGWVTGSPERAKMGDGVTPWSGLDYILRGEVISVNGAQGAVVITKDDIGLDRVDNTSDIDKPLSTAQSTALGLKAPKDSPVFTGTPEAPTPETSDDSDRIATTKFVNDKNYITIESVDPRLRVGSYDTGWVGLTLSTGWSGTAHYRIIGGVVYLRGKVTRDSGTNTTISTLPAAARPVQSMNMKVRTTATHANASNFAVSSGGGLVISSAYSTGSTVELESVGPFPLG